LDTAFFPSKTIPGPGYPTPPQTIFEKGMTKTAVIVPFLLSVPACTLTIAMLKWFKKE
jgi:hypothetical protein